MNDNDFRLNDDEEKCTQNGMFKQGAEAKLYKCKYFGRDAVLKERFSKKYRHPELEKTLSCERFKTELRTMCKCKMSGIDVPAVYFVDSNRNQFIMEFICGSTTLRNYIEELEKQDDCNTALEETGHRIGSIVAKVHGCGMIHGDLTSSNFLLRDKDPKRLVLIDFGLSEGSATNEKKAVDLYVLERALRSTHDDTEHLFDCILDGYEKQNPAQYKGVKKKLDEVRMRGRKREVFS